MANNADVPYRIGTVAAGFLVTFAVVTDMLQFVLNLFIVTAPIATLLSFFADAVLGLWLLILGVKYFSGKKSVSNLLTMLGTLALEFVPFFDALPAYTFGIIVLIRNSRAEDRQNYEESAKAASVAARTQAPQAENGNETAYLREAA